MKLERGWRVTYYIVTPESAEYGYAEERGFIVENGTFREAFNKVLETEFSAGIECIKPDCYPYRDGDFRSIYVTNGMDPTGASESRAIHFPERITPASRLRVLKLMKGE
jgi:hypothetical protein